MTTLGISLLGVALLGILVGFTTQQLTQSKPVLQTVEKGQEIVRWATNETIYHRKAAYLYLGADDEKQASPKKVLFIVDFMGKATVVPGYYSKTCPKGYNFTSSLGFERLSSVRQSQNYRGISFVSERYLGWLRLDSGDNISSGSSKSNLQLNVDCSSWVSQSPVLEDVGLISLGPQSTFFEMLVQTYQPEVAEEDRIPVSWFGDAFYPIKSLNSSVNIYKTEGSLMINGYRSTKRQFGMRAPVIKRGVWYYESMDFQLGSKWSAYNQTVCIDPYFPGYLGLPPALLEQFLQIVGEIIYSNSSDGSISEDGAYKIPPLEISLFSSFQNKSDPEEVDFLRHLELNYSEMFISGAGTDNKSIFTILSSNRSNGGCLETDFVVGEGFFSKVEMTFWLKRSYTADSMKPDNVLISFSPYQFVGKSLPYLYYLCFSFVLSLVCGFMYFCIRVKVPDDQRRRLTDE